MNSPHKWPVMRKTLPFDDVFMWNTWTCTWMLNHRSSWVYDWLPLASNFCGDDAITWRRLLHMMTSSNWNIFRVTGPLLGESNGHRWIPLTKATTRSFDIFFDLHLNKGWANDPNAGDLRRHHAHYYVTVMITSPFWGLDFPNKEPNHGNWKHTCSFLYIAK